MAILSKDTYRKPVIDLNGPEGNAFSLLGTAKRYCGYADLSDERTEEILTELKSGDYEHLITTFDKYFGSAIDLER